MPVAGPPPLEAPPPRARAGAYLVPPPPTGRHRRWLPPILLMVVLLFVVFGGYFVAVGAGVTAPPGQRDAARSITVGGINFRPLPGWGIARRFPGEAPGVLLTRGIGNLLVAADPAAPSAEAALDSYFEQVLHPEATEFQAGETSEEVIRPGVTALRRPYAGTFAQNPAPLEGDVTAFVLPRGAAVIFDGWAQEGSYQMFAQDVYAMAETAEVA